MSRIISPERRISVLSAAIHQDPIAQREILEYFDAYINALSTVSIHTPDGQKQTYLDEDIKVQIQETLLEAIRHFELDEILRTCNRRKRK